jgi:hypothetical protein
MKKIEVVFPMKKIEVVFHLKKMRLSSIFHLDGLKEGCIMKFIFLGCLELPKL